MHLNHWPVPLLLLLGLTMGGCAVKGKTELTPTPTHDNLDAVLWQQTSTESAAVTSSLYAAATVAAEKIAAAAPDRVDSMAIVLDVDETVLDNSPYQAQLVFDDATYAPDSWDDWIARRDAAAIPGVVDFLRRSRALGFHVAFITNRRCKTRPNRTDACPQIEDTLANLRRVGIDTESTTIYLRGDRPSAECQPFLSEAEQDDGTWSSDKTSRRRCVGLEHEIVMLFGDQLGDFIEVAEQAAGRPGRDLAADHAERWGTTWFMLPNPTYGGWRPGNSVDKRERLRGFD